MLTRCRSISSQGCLCYNAIAENHKENFNSLYLGMRILLSFLFSMIRSSKIYQFLQSRGICILHFGTVQLRTRMDLCSMHTNCKFNPPKTITNRTRIEKLGFSFFFWKMSKKCDLSTLWTNQGILIYRNSRLYLHYLLLPLLQLKFFRINCWFLVISILEKKIPGGGSYSL